MFLKTPKEHQLKYTNPIRDYCHLLSNRLVHLLINLADEVQNAKVYFDKKSSEPWESPSFELAPMESVSLVSYLKNLREGIDSVVKHLKRQLSYQHDVKIVIKNKSKMRNAEREINKITYAFDILSDNGFPIIRR